MIRGVLLYFLQKKKRESSEERRLKAQDAASKLQPELPIREHFANAYGRYILVVHYVYMYVVSKCSHAFMFCFIFGFTCFVFIMYFWQFCLIYCWRMFLTATRCCARHRTRTSSTCRARRVSAYRSSSTRSSTSARSTSSRSVRPSPCL